MDETLYANAYKEVFVVINNLALEDYNKIPKEYNFRYDNTKSFAEQNLLEETEAILFRLFEEFGATEKQKEKLNKYRHDYYYILNEKKREKYNTNNMFKNNKKKEVVNTQEYYNNLPIEIKKTNFIRNFIVFLKNLFRKDN